MSHFRVALSSVKCDMTINDRLRAARNALGLKQSDIAEQSGVSERAYQGYEAARSIPGGEAIAGMVRAGINANWLLTGEGPMLLSELCSGPPEPYKLDVVMLRACMGAVEKYIRLKEFEPSIETKTGLTAALYRYAEAKGMAEPADMEEFLKLVA